MSGSTIPIKYVLYSHYGYKDGYGEKDDFSAYQNGTPLQDLEGVRHLLSHSRGLRELLTSPGHEGILVLFYAPGYERFLKALYQKEDDESLRSRAREDVEIERLFFAEAVAEFIRKKLKEENLEQRVRFLTSFDLRVILGLVNTIFSGQFPRFFIGPDKGIRYDAPKVVEAILRLRVLGNGVPVLRLDHDVIFRGENKKIGDLGLFKAVACAMRAYQLRLAQPSVSTFLFSASYNSRALLDPNSEMDPFEAWSRAFATRVQPALVANPKKIRDICDLPDTTDKEKEHKNNSWKNYVDEHLDEALVRQFYGLKQDTVGLEADGMTGLASIGAHSLYAVISGALLCLSEGAILDLPPFSNFGTNVMWIDDHLKYSLHRAMGHFTSGETLNLEPGLSDARLDDVTTTKGRPSVNDIHSYVFDVYLPTLLWGTIMDAWITTDPILKCRLATLGPNEKQRWRDARQKQYSAPLPRAMLKALRIGDFDHENRRRLRDELMQGAVERIEIVRQLWAGLRTDSKTTFASYWAQGQVKETFGDSIFKDCKGKLWQGISTGIPLDEPITRIQDLTAELALKVNALIEDAVTYVAWTLEWPKFVQIVRSIHHGDFVGDLGWQPK